MSVIPLPAARRSGAEPGRTDAQQFTTNATGLIHDVTAPLLGALLDAVTAAAGDGVNDTGARAAAERLRDAWIALDLAVIAAGRALADRELPIRGAVADAPAVA